MNLGLTSLLDAIAAAPQQRFLLVTVIQTHGPSYRKPGAMMLIGEDGSATGLVSGGCLETDLRLQGTPLFDSGDRKLVTYDLREDDDELWGLGIGCQGVIHLHLERADADNVYAGLGLVEPHWRGGRYCEMVKTLPDDPTQPASVEVRALTAPDAASTQLTIDGDARGLTVPVYPPSHLLICGAGPDVPPLVSLAQHSGWRVTVFDHRPAYAKPEHFDAATRVICGRPEALLEHVAPCDAAVVMSHHLLSDIEYSRQLASTDVRYVGLLGPAARRQEIINKAELGPDARYHGPAGLDIGADLPETIALSILAEAHAALNDGRGGSLTRHD